MAAITISIVSYYLFGSRFIYFGVIHFFLVATIVTRPIKHQKITLALGIAILLSSQFLHIDAMNPNYLNWIGLNSIKPATEDYAPLFPWLGLFWIGLSLNKFFTTLQTQNKKKNLFSVLGKNSLITYLIHQPLLFLFLYISKILVTI
jgi:uncharacterized membrane protein